MPKQPLKRIVAIIPCRGGSKSIPYKNISLLNGKPLLWYAFETARKSRCLDAIFVSTEDARIKKVCKQYRIPVIERPRSLALDNTPTLPVLRQALLSLESRGEFFDALLLLQATSPFVSSASIKKSIALLRNSNFDAVMTAQPTPWHFHPVNARRILPGKKIAFAHPAIKRRYLRRQDAPASYAFGNLVVSTRETILHKKSVFGTHTGSVMIQGIESWNIDDPVDLIMAESVMRYAKDMGKDVFQITR